MLDQAGLPHCIIGIIIIIVITNDVRTYALRPPETLLIADHPAALT